jgi:hypothetical protein
VGCVVLPNRATCPAIVGIDWIVVLFAHLLRETPGWEVVPRVAEEVTVALQAPVSPAPPRADQSCPPGCDERSRMAHQMRRPVAAPTGSDTGRKRSVPITARAGMANG